jgi:aryl-alcohol dehydrogenase-like predicted oxidoreductase
MSLQGSHHENSLLLRSAFDKGIQYFDTADVYQNGFNEETVGRAFRDIRDRVILATKVGNQPKTDGAGFHWNASRSYILEAVEKSLRRLQTDYIDLYQLHGGTLEDPIDETIDAFETLKKQGKIRHYGISSIRPNVIREYAKRSNMVSVMMQYSLLDRRPEEECLNLLQQHSISVLCRGSLAKGLLVDKEPEPFLRYTRDDVQRAASAVRAVSTSERSAAASALHFVLDHPAVTSAVAGIRTAAQLQACLEAAETPHLGPHERLQLENSIKPDKYDQHR